jgi:hypothetical protein
VNGQVFGHPIAVPAGSEPIWDIDVTVHDDELLPQARRERERAGSR